MSVLDNVEQRAGVDRPRVVSMGSQSLQEIATEAQTLSAPVVAPSVSLPKVEEPEIVVPTIGANSNAPKKVTVDFSSPGHPEVILEGRWTGREIRAAYKWMWKAYQKHLSTLRREQNNAVRDAKTE